MMFLQDKKHRLGIGREMHSSMTFVWQGCSNQVYVTCMLYNVMPYFQVNGCGIGFEGSLGIVFGKEGYKFKIINESSDVNGR